METYHITFRNFIGHLHTVNRHRFKVFQLCLRCGIPIQGLLHDLSKYSICEFWEGVKYYAGTYSPIKNCKKDIGYSPAWLHHKGRNRHHYEYWYDYAAPNMTPVMPFRYFLEMICDTLAAGMVYEGKNWTPNYQLEYWNKAREKAKMDARMKDLLTNVYQEFSKQGIKKVLRKKYLYQLYQEYMGGLYEKN